MSTKTWSSPYVLTDAAAAKMGVRILRLRKTLGLTQVQLARQARCKQPMISKLELGQVRDPGAAMLAAVAQALMTTPAFLLEGTGEEQQTTRLNDQERDLLNVFRLLEDRDRDRVIAIAKTHLDIPPPPTNEK